MIKLIKGIGGPAGSALAATLARSEKKPTVLLLEAGQRREEKKLRVDGQRWIHFKEPGINWGYKTVPQEHCHDREIDYSRGRVLGGSSAINFGVYTVGAKDDYDEWAAMVGDNNFCWHRMQDRFKEIENFHGDTLVKENAKYAAPQASDHGFQGLLHVGFAAEWD